MKQSKSRKSRETTAFLYERLSRDDNLDGDSYSIQNQELLCKGWSHHLIHMTAVHLWQMVHSSCEKGGVNAKTKIFDNCGQHFATNGRK